MCFSASASFGAGVVLSVVGIASIRKVENRQQAAFACIPFIFAIQQITEGFLWLALSDADYASLKWPATYLFLFFAQIVWPFWVPFAILNLETDPRRKKVQRVLMIVGAIVSAYLGLCLLTCEVDAEILGMHISYEQFYPAAFSGYGGLLYIVATIAPPFFSSVKRMWALGTAILISYIVTAIFYVDYIVSVWCFFASVISIAVLVILYGMKKSSRLFTPLIAD